MNREIKQPDLANADSRMLENLYAGVEFVDSELASKLYYEPSLGSLALRDGEATRLVLFRGQKPDASDRPKAHDLLNRSTSEIGVRNTVYGRGLYLGNSPESVGVFGTKDSGREIAAYLTPPIQGEDILIAATPDDTTVSRTKDFSKELKLFTQGFVTPYHKRLQRIEQAYEKHQLVVLNMHVGTRIAQRLQMQAFTHPIRPLWYLWRNMDNQFLRVGTATHQLSLKPWLQKVTSAKIKP